jgi:hypothetical protein
MNTLTLSHSTIRGFVTGKAISCTVRSSPAGLKLATGRYLLRPAENNPVYGLVISIEPMPSQGPGPAAVKLPAMPKDAASATAARPVGPGPAAVKLPAMPKVVPSGTAAREGGAAIVMSSRAIAGNCLVVTTGFDDLVDAVQHTGGVTLIVT